MKVLMIVTTLFVPPMVEGPVETYRGLVEYNYCIKEQKRVRNERVSDLQAFSSYTIIQCHRVNSI